MSMGKNATQIRMLFAILLGTVSSSAVASAATYYVAVTGNDANNGTSSASPFLTIQAAANKVNPGDTVLIGDGVYKGSRWTLVDIARGGAAGKPVTFRAEHAGAAKLVGSNSATLYGWTFESGVSYVNLQNLEISNFAQVGVYFLKNKNINVTGMLIHNIGNVCSDSTLGMTGLYASQSSMISISDNVIYNIGRYAPGENGCQPTTAYYKNHDHAIYLDGVSNINVQNNTTYGIKAGWAVQVYSSSSTLSSGITINNNRFLYANPWTDGSIMLASPGLNTGSITNNLFVSPRNQALVFWGTQKLSAISVTGNTTEAAVITKAAPTGVTLSGNTNRP